MDFGVKYEVRGLQQQTEQNRLEGTRQNIADKHALMSEFAFDRKLHLSFPHFSVSDNLHFILRFI